MAYKHDAEHNVAKTSPFWQGFISIGSVFFSKYVLKTTFEAMAHILKLITVTFVIEHYGVKFLFLCRNVIFNEILSISDHIFLSLFFSWTRLVNGSKSGSQVAKITQFCFSNVQHWFQYLHISIWCHKNVAYEQKWFFPYNANLWNAPKPRWRQIFTIAFIKVLLINEHRGTVKHS